MHLDSSSHAPRDYRELGCTPAASSPGLRAHTQRRQVVSPPRALLKAGCPIHQSAVAHPARTHPRLAAPSPPLTTSRRCPRYPPARPIRSRRRRRRPRRPSSSPESAERRSVPRRPHPRSSPGVSSRKRCRVRGKSESVPRDEGASLPRPYLLRAALLLAAPLRHGCGLRVGITTAHREGTVRLLLLQEPSCEPSYDERPLLWEAWRPSAVHQDIERCSSGHAHSEDCLCPRTRATRARGTAACGERDAARCCLPCCCCRTRRGQFGRRWIASTTPWTGPTCTCDALMLSGACLDSMERQQPHMGLCLLPYWIM
jgi:hypothetical protein